MVIRIAADYETAERSGASGTFQVVSIIIEDENGSEKDITAKIDQGRLYHSAEDVIRDLGYDPEKVDFELV